MKNSSKEDPSQPKRGETILVKAKNIEALDIKHLGKSWDYLRVESVDNGVILFVSKREKDQKNINAIGGNCHPYCRSNEFLAFRPFQEGTLLTFEYLFKSIKRRRPGKKDIEAWWQGLAKDGVRAVEDPEETARGHLLIFLNKKWSYLINLG